MNINPARYLVVSLPLIMAVAGCSPKNSDAETCSRQSLTDASGAINEAPELIRLQTDSAAIQGRWVLEKYHCPYFDIQPTVAYILEINGYGLNLKFMANELRMEYALSGDTLNCSQGIITQVKGADEPIETALTDLLFHRNERIIEVNRSDRTYLTITADGNEYAAFRKIG